MAKAKAKAKWGGSRPGVGAPSKAATKQVRIDADLAVKAKVVATLRGKTLPDLLTDMLRKQIEAAYLAETAKPK